MPPSLHDDLLEHAQTTIGSGSGRPSQVVLRRSISSSYYAAWHCICDAWAGKFANTLQHQLSRCPAHTAVKKAAGVIKSGNSDWTKNCCPEMNTLCEDFIRLQKTRHSADYDVARRFRKNDANEAHSRANRILDSLKWLAINKGDELDAFLLECLNIKCPNR